MRTLGLKRNSSEIFVTTFATGASLFFDESLDRCPSDSITSPSDSSLEEAEDHDEKRWGSDDPTRASFAFSHGLALADAGHEVQIFLTGEATYLMRKATVDAVKPIGWPPLSETMEKIVSRKIPVFS